MRFIVILANGCTGNHPLRIPNLQEAGVGQFARSSNVAGGRIRAQCSRCGTTAFLEVAPNARRRIYRCKCGKSTNYSINYRKERRETSYGPAKVVMRNAQEQKIRLNDTSLSGVSFFVASEQALSMRRGMEVGIKFRADGSSALQRKIRIKSIIKNRIGAEYVRNIASW